MKVQEFKEFEPLESNWNNILSKTLIDNNVFLTWEWLSTWWKNFSEGKRLLNLLVEDEGKIIAIAPLMLSKYDLPGFGKIRKIEFVGAPHSDYHGIIVLDKRTECFKSIINYLLDAIADWDWIELKEIPESPGTDSMISESSIGFFNELGNRKRICNICPYVPLKKSLELQMGELSKNTRQRLRRSLRKLNETHKVDLLRYDEAGFSVEQGMDIFIDLHEKRWSSKGSRGVFSRNGARLRNFHIEAAKSFAEKEWLGLYFLTIDNEPAAAQYTFEYGQKMYYYLAGFDPKYSDYSVGDLIIMFLLKKSISKGFTEYDLLRGDEPYKMHWTNTCRKNLEIRFVRKRLRSRFYDSLTWSTAVNGLAKRLGVSLRKGSS